MSPSPGRVVTKWTKSKAMAGLKSNPTAPSADKSASIAATKLFSSPAIQFKGTGWYITDYARKGQTAQSDTTGSTNSGKSESGGGESATAKPSAEAGVTQPVSKSDNKTENRIESKTAAASSKKE